MLRPIDAIFRHPVKKFTVIYQSGKLWQLPQLAFDGNSLQYKRPYTGSREQIFVAQTQALDPADALLNAKLITIELPATVVGANVDEFEQWWTKKGFDYRQAVAESKARQAQALARLQSATTTPTKTEAVSPSVPIKMTTSTPVSVAPAQPPVQSTVPPQVQSQAQPHGQNAIPSTASPPDEGNLFDAMMNDLTKDLN